MGRSRRKYKKSRAKVRVGLPRKKPGFFKPAFTVPLELLTAGVGEQGKEWDDEGSVIRNYRTFGVVANPNLHGVCARTPRILQCASLQVPASAGGGNPISEFDPIKGGSDGENDDLKSALGKRRRDGKTAPLQPLTTIQRVHVGRLIDKYGNDYQAMFMDTQLNAMQHSVAELKKLCLRYHVLNVRRTRGLNLQQQQQQQQEEEEGEEEEG